MTTTRAILGTTASFVGLIVATAWLSMVADVMGRHELGRHLNNAAWMLVVLGASFASAGAFIYLVCEFKKEVRGGTRAWAGDRSVPGARSRVSPRSIGRQQQTRYPERRHEPGVAASGSANRDVDGCEGGEQFTHGSIGLRGGSEGLAATGQ